MKRATRHGDWHFKKSDISIHALMKRATMQSILPIFGDFYFNPRPHEEGDRAAQKNFHGASISIHALMKRATYQVCGYVKRCKDFNPRPHEEGDDECR